MICRQDSVTSDRPQHFPETRAIADNYTSKLYTGKQARYSTVPASVQPLLQVSIAGACLVIHIDD